MNTKALKNVSFKVKSEEVLGELEALSFFFSKTQQEIIEEALAKHWKDCLAENNELEGYKLQVISNFKKGLKIK